MDTKRPAFMICHSIPGRIRIRVPWIRSSPHRAQEVEKALKNFAPVQKLDIRLKTGSIILVYEPHKGHRERILERLKSVLPGCERTPAPGKPGNPAFSLAGQLLNVAALTGFMGYVIVRRVLGRPPLSQSPSGLMGLVTLIGAVPLLRRAVTDLRQGKGPGLFPFLAGACGLAIVAGQAMTAFEIIWVLSFGMLLEGYVTERAKRAIREAFEVIPQQAEMVLNGVEILRPVSQVKRGDTVIARAGKRIPVDGQVLRGEGLVDESHITGRSEPEFRDRGGRVFAGTRVTQGVLYIRAEAVGPDTYLSRITRLVEDALALRGEAEKRADVLARRLTRIGVAATLGTLVLTRNVARAISVMLVVACPCATVLAASTAIAAAIANGARRQILIKGGLYLENMSAVRVALFDKTGTVTAGLPEVVEIVPFHRRVREETLLALAATAEARSEHPLARVLVEEAAQRGILPEKADSLEEAVGSGVRAVAGSHTILVGNRTFMEREGVDVSRLKARAKKHGFAGRAVLFIARNGRPQGMIALANPVRPETKSVLARLRKDGISRMVLVSGDTEAAARAVAQDLGFDECRAPLLPNEKARLVEMMEAGGMRVLVVGDGVNDALALSKATVGVAMGAGGCEVAVEAADITLGRSDLNDLVFLRLLSRRALRTIEQNFWLANGTNVLGILAGFGGWMGPSAAGLLHVIHTLGIMFNSSRLLSWSPDGTGPASASAVISEQEF